MLKDKQLITISKPTLIAYITAKSGYAMVRRPSVRLSDDLVGRQGAVIPKANFLLTLPFPRRATIIGGGIARRQR